MSRIASFRPSTRSSSRRASRFAAVFVLCGCFLISFRASPVPFLRVSLSFPHPFAVSSRRPGSRNRYVKGVPYSPMSYALCRRSAPRSVFLPDVNGVSSPEALGGEEGGEFYGTFHVKQRTSPCILRGFLGAVSLITQACRAFPCDGCMRFRAVIMSCGAFRICRFSFHVVA